MAISKIVVYVLVALSYHIEISSGIPPKRMNFPARFGITEEEWYNQGNPSSGQYSSDRQNAPSSALHPVSFLADPRNDYPTIPLPQAGIPLRLRSRSPPAVDENPPDRHPSVNVLDCGFDQMRSIRLVSRKNPQLIFELRKYEFPAEKSLQLIKGPNKYEPIPTKEHIVLSTANSDVFAIKESGQILAGIYAYNSRLGSRGRFKINMNSGKLTPLTSDEIKETPVGSNRQLLYSYRLEHVNTIHGPPAPAEPPLGLTSSFPLTYMSLPTSLPGAGRSVCGLDQLQFIRLIPKKNQEQIFELQRYTFPPDKLLFVNQGANYHGPIPIQELIVLTTLAGEVYAILESDSELAGIYTYNTRTRSKVRAKIDMRSGTITELSKDEMREVPVGRNRPISLNFGVHHVNNDPPCH